MSAIIKKAEEDTLAEILTWVQEVVEGRGDSIAQMIVTTVLGCIPFVGQAVDAYNILRSIYALIHDVDNADHWIELVLCLIALVPLFGDALKNVFKMLRNGKAMGRILDSLPSKVRGDIVKWFRELNWASYTRELVQSIDNILGSLIDVLDTRITKWVLGRTGVQKLIKQLNDLKRVAQRKIEEAMNTLRLAHQKSMMQPLPSTASHVPSLPKAPKSPTPKSGASPTVAKTTGGTKTPKSGQASATQRQSQKAKQSRSYTGASGEHIADYYYVKRQRSRSKVSNRGVLFEMKQPGHNGIDHVWHGARLPLTYRVSDTKGTVGAFHKLETAAAVFEGLRYGIDAYLGDQDEKRTANALGNTVGDGKQLSHRWVAKKIISAQILPTHSAILLPAIEAWRRAGFKIGSEVSFESGEMKRGLVKCPYDRSLITVVGPNHNKHKTAKGAESPRCCKPASSHQIGTEFVLPNTMLIE